MTMIRRILSICLLAAGINVMAQQISVKSLTLLPGDQSAIEMPVYDNLKDPCALLKIDVGGLKGLFFPKLGKDHKADSLDEKTGIYLVYIPTGTKRLAYNHKDYLPGEIVFANLIENLEPGKTYLLTMEAEANRKSEGIVIFNVTPHYAQVVFNGKEAAVTGGGMYTYSVKPGKYDYTIYADDHVPQKGTANVELGKETKIATDLQWILHSVSVNCNVSDAQVYVDNVYYGKPGKFRLPQGKHKIGVKADGYLDNEQTVEISANTSSFPFLLKKNENKTIIGAVDVTIYSMSNSSRMFKNQKQIKEWKKSGDVVKLMPGKYLLSDDDYNEYKLVIKKGSAPITVRF